jgi:hypothetical protein
MKPASIIVGFNNSFQGGAGNKNGFFLAGMLVIVAFVGCGSVPARNAAEIDNSGRDRASASRGAGCAASDLVFSGPGEPAGT